MRHRQDNTSGILYMLAGIALLVGMDAVAKYLVLQGIDPIQIIGIRSVFIVALLWAYYGSRQRRAELMPTRPKAQLLRGLLGFLAPYFYFKSLQSLPLADATVIFFSSVFIVTTLSWPLLKEKVGPHRWFAVVLGFVGVVIAMQPEGGGKLSSYAYCLIASVTYALLFISGRLLSKTETVISLVFSFNAALAVICWLLMPMIWVPISLTTLAVMLGLAGLAMAGHICITQAFSRAPVSVIAPFEYTALLWAVVLGYFWWGDLPSLQVLLGAMMIVACGLYVIYRESVQHGRS